MTKLNKKKVNAKLNKKQVNAKLNEVANAKNAKRDESTKLPLNREGKVYTVTAVELDSDTVVNCNGKIAEVATGTKVTKCCVSTGETGGKGKVFYQLNEVDVWLETRDLREFFGVAAEKEPKGESHRATSSEKQIIQLLKENPKMSWETAAEMVAKRAESRRAEAESEKRVEKASRLGLTKEELQKMLESME